MSFSTRPRKHYSVTSKPVELKEPPSLLPSWVPVLRHCNIVTCTLSVLTIISLTTATLVVHFTSSNQTNRPCKYEFKSVVGNSIGLDSQPRSAAVADFNNDTKLDIAVAHRANHAIGIFLGYGNGTFASQTIYSTGADSDPYSIVIGDFTNDHYVDIAVANHDTNSIRILFGKGDGTFENQTTVSLNPSRPIFITAGDLNQDNCLDIVIASPSTSNIGILLGYGNGYFRMQITYSTGFDSLPHSIVVNDFNNDSYLDIAVANFGTNSVLLFLGYENETFMSQLIFPTGLGSNPCSIAAGDFNHDNHLDIVVANEGTSTIGILIGYGNGTFGEHRSYLSSPQSRPFYVVLGDFNDDHHLDIAVSDASTYNISVFLGIGSGIFEISTTHLMSSKSISSGIAAGDFDNDHQSDIVVVNAETNSIVILTKYATEPTKYPTTYSNGAGSSPYQVLTSDFNKDTNLDLVVVNMGTNDISVFLGYGNGSFEPASTYSTGDFSGPIALAIGDFNNDQQLDIVTCNDYSNTLGIFLGYGNGSFSKVNTYLAYRYFSPVSIVVADFNNNGIQDLAVVSYGPNALNILTGFGNGSFQLLAIYSTGDGSRPFSVAAADFNNDHKLDIVVANYGTDNVGVFLGYGDGTFGVLTTYSSGYGSGPTSVCVADLNNDHHVDIVVSNYNINNVGIFLGHGNGTFGMLNTYSTGDASIPYGLTAGDLNDDGCQDVIVANNNANNIGVLLGYCNGNFTSQLSFPTGPNSNPCWVAIGDLNNDNRLDVVSANNGGNSITVLLGHPATTNANSATDTIGFDIRLHSLSVDNLNSKSYRYHTDGKESMNGIPVLLLGDYYSDFQSETVYSTGSGSHPYSIVVGDFNNDSLLDMAVANSGNENIAILFGYGNGSFSNEHKYSIGSGSRPQYLIATAIQKDDLLTIIATNPVQDNLVVLHGHDNGTFNFEMKILTGSGSSPSSIATGDFNHDNFTDLIVANPGTDSIGIVLGYHYTTFQTATKYSSGNLSYPLAMAIGDLNNDNRLDIVVAGYATNNIGVLLGYGNGSFSSQTIYDMVIGSLPYAIALGDFNNDNNLDITTANWASSNIGVLLGYGNGSFAIANYYTTGFATRPVGITVGDLNNDHYLDIVTSNFGAESVSVFLGYGNGTFTNFMMHFTGISSSPRWVSLYDLNRDNHTDIIVSNQGSNDLGILFGYGNGNFTSIVKYAISSDCAPCFNTAADLNSDGQLDIIVACLNTGNIGVFFGYHNETFAAMTTYATSFSSAVSYIIVGDFNGDNQQDIAAANSYNSYIDIFFRYGNEQFMSSVPYPMDVGTSVFSFGAGDLNDDGKLDIVYADATNNNVGVLLASGIQHFGGQRSLSMRTGSKPVSVAVGNFNNDEWLDIVAANNGADNIVVLLGIENVNFEDMKIYPTGDGSKPLSVAINDMNSDNLTDIVVANSGSGNIIIFFGDGNGTFPITSEYSTGTHSCPVSVATGDFNGDGYLDIIVANSLSNNIRVLLGNGAGAFVNHLTYSVEYGSHPNSIALGNFNNDNVTEIVVANNMTNTVLILLKVC